MRNNLAKKYSVWCILAIYVLAYFLQSFSFFDFGIILNKTYAESQLDYTNLVAIFVDEEIYDDIETDIKRYAQTYIQWEDSDDRYNSISNSKAIVMPIDIENVSATDITKILENIYFDGINNEPSKLVWTVLIWDIPLPVINQDGFIYPTIYPYVDFEEQKFIWNEQQNYFIYNDNPDAQAEIWHGIINFDDIISYDNYFDKLRDYSSEPSEFIGKSIWYDDLVANKQYFYNEAINSYVNNFMFAEDIWHRRYTDLMVKLMQWAHNDMIAELLEWFDGMEELNAATEQMNTPTMTLKKMIDEWYLKTYTSLIWPKQLDNIVTNVETANRWTEYYTWSDGVTKTRTALDTHYLKTELKDETLLRMNWWLDPLILTFNNVLEDIVNDKIEEEKYWMNEVIPLSYLKYTWDKKKNWWTRILAPRKYTCSWKDYDAFKNYFFGTEAKNIRSMKETSTYRWSFRNYNDIAGLTVDDIQSSDYPASDIADEIDLNKKSVWGSYDIFATQTDANRWFNINNSIEEYAVYNALKTSRRDLWKAHCNFEFWDICRSRRTWKASEEDWEKCVIWDKEQQWGCEMPPAFAIRNRGGASPLNLSGMSDWASGYNFQDAILPVFDIGGSKEIQISEPAANSFEWVSEYTRLIQKTFVPDDDAYYSKNKDKKQPAPTWKGYDSSMWEEMKFTNREAYGSFINPSRRPVTPKTWGYVDYFDKFNSTTYRAREWDILKLKKHQSDPSACLWNWEVYTYKTLDSRVRNTLTTKDQIGGISFKVFQDPTSPSKILNEWIQDKLDILNESVDPRISSLDINTSWWINYNIDKLWNYIDAINIWISNITAQDVSQLNWLSTTEINTKANEWKNYFVEQNLNTITWYVAEIKDQFIDLDFFVWSFNHDPLSWYIKNQLYNFEVNKRNLVLHDSWRTNILTDIVGIKNKFHSIDWLLDVSNGLYLDIDGIMWSSDLVTKLAQINYSILSGTLPIWCAPASAYLPLCWAIIQLQWKLLTYWSEANDSIDEIKEFEEVPGGWTVIKPFISIWEKTINPIFISDHNNLLTKIWDFPTSDDIELIENKEWMNLTTSDRPIDSPKYITFKGIWWDKVNFIYPNIYKSEVFSWDNILNLKSPENIAEAIKENLRETVKKYNEYLLEQSSKKTNFYNQNSAAYNLLADVSHWWDLLASPNSPRPYNLMEPNFLINELEERINNGSFFFWQMDGNDPIEFIAEMIYYQNIGRQQREVWETIQWDINNTIAEFDVNNKISHIVDNYLIKDNNRWNFITPWYRDEWYEVAFINSDGADYIDYKDEPAFIQRVNNARNNFKQQTRPAAEQTNLEEALLNNCNIPEEWWVLLFDLQEWWSPWADALKCWREQILDAPLKFEFDRSSVQWPPITFWDEWDTVWEVIAENLWIDNIQSQYMNQLDLLDTDDENEEILDNSNPWDYAKLEKIISYAKLETNTQNINADTASGTINISSSKTLWNVEFHIENIGDSIINFDESEFTLDPFDTKALNFNIDEPIDGINVVMFHMCLPGTQNIENCVKKSLRLDIIPGAINETKINTPGNKILEWSKMPIAVEWLDQFENWVGQLVWESFTISVSTGSISHKSATTSEIKFSDFDKSDFVLNAEAVVNWTEIRVDIDGYIGWNEWTQASSIIQVVKWDLNLEYNNDAINNTDQININLASTNEYAYKDWFDLTQANLNTIPKIKLNLVDNIWNPLNIESIVRISSKNWLVKPMRIETRMVTKNQNDMIFEVEQNRFKWDNNYIISNGSVEIYLMPSFKAGEDILYISMPWIDDIELPVLVNPAPASMVELNTKKSEIATNSNTKANFKVMDIWGNIITQDTVIKLGVIGPINISGSNSSSSLINVQWWEHNFEINSQEQWGAWFVYALINDLALEEQKPWNAIVTVQNRLLPDEDLNIMYLNLFGSDWWNQRGYLSENNKYIESLINNSEKLLATTTQLVMPTKIKKFAAITDYKLQIANIEEKEISLNLNNNGNSIWSLDLEIKDVWTINIDIEASEFRLKEVDVSDENMETVITALISDYDEDNILIYLPEDTDSIIESNEISNNAIHINNENIFDLGDVNHDNKLSIELTTETLIWYQVWNVILSDKKIWTMLISVEDSDAINIDMLASDIKYDYNSVWLNGSTNNNWIWFYEIDSSLDDTTMWYDSIQNSIDPTLWLWFRSDFKNITNFGAWEPVWESTIPFSSEFLINIWDPLLKRIDQNESAKIYDEDWNLDTDTWFDKWLWEVIYSEPWKTIFKVINIDFNNDDLEDIIVAFTDGSIKILKNYGGNKPFEQLWDLMILADGIKEIIIWDVDGNDYEDIIIWSKWDTLRVYKNEEWVFDVDGYPICINVNVHDGVVSENPQDISGIFQIFFEDMDQDGSLDVVVNDKLGFIKIFYGWTDNPQNLDNYVSNDKYKCDDWRHERLNYWNDTTNPNTKMAYRFGIRVNENVKVLDKSSIHRQWINPDEEIEITAEDLWVDTSMFSEENMEDLDPENMDGLLEEAMNFDMGAAEEWFMVSERYKDSNFGQIPVYEDIWTWTEADIKYVEAWCLTGDDPVDMYKKFEDLNGTVLENGDIVKISVIIKANEDFVWTFIDRISWPWEISLLEDGMMEHFWFDTGSISQDTVENELKFHRDISKARYMIDNIILSAWEELRFNYWATYDGDVQTNKIEIGDINGADYERWANWVTWDIMDEYDQDNYPDIKIKPANGCNKSMFVLFNEDQDKDYKPEYIDLTEIMMAYSADSQATMDNAMSDVTNTLSDNANSDWETPDMSSIPWLWDMLESWDSTDILWDTFDTDTIISQWWVDLSNIANAPSQLLDSLLWDVMDKVDDFMWGLCDGFDLSEMWVWAGWGCGLPIPFNQWFLWPGNYHVFGCFEIDPLTETLWKWRPVLNIPGNWTTPTGILPFPGIFWLPLRGPDDNFLWWPKWWSYSSLFRLYLVPTLTAELWIAMCFGPYTVGDAIPDPASSIGWNCVVVSVPLCGDDEWTWPNGANKIPPAFLDLETCTDQNVPCFVWEGESTSSFEMVSSSDNSSNMTTAVPDGSFAGWFINIEKDPVTTHGYNNAESGIDIDGVNLFWWADWSNKILGSAAQWLIEKLSKNWMDKQIKYIISNLTNFKIDVYWPDFGGMMKWMWKWDLAKALEEDKIKDCRDQKWMRIKELKTESPHCYISPKQKCENRWKKRESENKTKIKTIRVQDWNKRIKYKDKFKREFKEEWWVCVKKPSPNQNDDAFGKIDGLAQNSLLDRKQITNLQNTSFANPFEKIEAMFEEVPLINLRTENITVKVPMISSEDITAYMHMSRNWIQIQEKILKEWFDLFKSLIGFCWWSKDINNFKELKKAYKDLKKKLEKEEETNDNDDGGQDSESAQEIEWISNKITQIKNLNDSYELNNLWNYEIYEACEWDNFWIKSASFSNVGQIIPDDVYLLFSPSEEDKMKAMTMWTLWYSLLLEDDRKWNNKQRGKIKLSYEKNWKEYNNDNICKKAIVPSTKNQCIDLFLWGKFELTLNNFLNIQSDTDGLISSVRQNIETLELYKKFPLDLYEWIHVGDRYMSEISSIINNFLGTLSLWMKTNATRYSQYVDALIMIMTTIQTYQAIIDLSVNWSEKCSSCTNDNYDQFACKLSLLCPDDLPIFKIPSMKVPSIYIDLSHMNLATDIKLPKFNFVPTTVPLPSLPNIPSPPTIDLSLSLEESLSLWLNIMEWLNIKLDNLNLTIPAIPAIPVIPSPPDLPEIPSFLPSVEMELPLLPPAPKIPELPNEISAAIDAAEVIWQIMCIVKWNIWLVWEASIKAKVEQMTQRDYEIPFWDNLDQTLSDRNTDDGWTKIPGWISDMFGFLKSSEFEEVELKWFDLWIDSYVNLQYNFAWFYDFIDQVVWEVNKYSGMPAELMQEWVDNLDEYSRALEAKMSACTTSPISQACMWAAYTWDIKKYKERTDKTQNQLKSMWDNIERWFDGVKEAMQQIAAAENERENLLNKNLEIWSGWNVWLEDTKIITNNRKRINELNIEIERLNNEYGDSIEAYELSLTTYWELLEKINIIKNKLSWIADDALNEVNDVIWEWNEAIDEWKSRMGEQFEKMQEEIKAKMVEFDTKQELRREIRDSWLDDLKKDVSAPKTDTISYVDYNNKTYQENLSILQDSLSKIKEATANESFKKEIDGYIKLSNINNKIAPATNNINNVIKDYTKIVDEYREQNKLITKTIWDDYDKFLYAVAQNDITLVWNDELNLSLSSSLFDIDKDSLNIIKQQEDINKVYLDYNRKNIDGYINALNSNSAEWLNMWEKEYNDSKKYMYELKEKTTLAYNILEEENINSKKILNNKDRKILAQSNGSSNGWAAGWAFTDISSYIDGKVIKTPEWSVDLANDEYVREFQGKSLMTDINDDWANDLLLRDRNNIYIKYRNWNNNYDYNHEDYIDNYYVYHISSYEDLLETSDEWFVKINNIYLKVCDPNWEIKNFRYNGGDFDSVKVTWMNSMSMWDEPAGYLIKMIHRVDLFNDKESITSNSNEELFDKKYILVLPKWAPLTGTKITLEEWTYRTEDILSGLIFDTMEYKENMNDINLTIQDIPRNWQYSEIYTLELYEESLYKINNSSSNQIVAWPQIIADNKWPEPIITLYRPAIDTIINTGEKFEWYVSTNYILQSNWEDNVSIDRLWIADEYGDIISTMEDVNEKTWYIELWWLFFTWAGAMNFYFGATDINGNSEVTQVNLKIKIPKIEIVDIQKYGNEIEDIWSPATITAEIEHDMDEGYVKFNRYRNDIRQSITGTLWWMDIDKYDLEPNQTIITGWYYDFGNDIWLYLESGELAAKVNPNNWKISIVDWFENVVNIQLDYSNKTPMIKVSENNGNILFLLSLPAEELINVSSTSLEIQDLDWDIFGDFNGGKAILNNDEVWIYVWPNGEIYTEWSVYGNYSFDDNDQTVQYGFKQNPNGGELWSIKVKIKNLLWE